MARLKGDFTFRRSFASSSSLSARRGGENKSSSLEGRSIVLASSLAKRKPWHRQENRVAQALPGSLGRRRVRLRACIRLSPKAGYAVARTTLSNRSWMEQRVEVSRSPVLESSKYLFPCVHEYGEVQGPCCTRRTSGTLPRRRWSPIVTTPTPSR